MLMNEWILLFESLFLLLQSIDYVLSVSVEIGCIHTRAHSKAVGIVVCVVLCSVISYNYTSVGNTCEIS